MFLLVIFGVIFLMAVPVLIVAIVKDWEGITIAFSMVALLCGIGFFSCLIVWNSAKVQTRIVNAKFDTNYTVEDMFWAGDTVINAIEGTYQRQKIDVKITE